MNNSPATKIISKNVIGSTTSKTKYPESHTFGTHKNDVSNDAGLTKMSEHVLIPSLNGTRYSTHNQHLMSPQVDDVHIPHVNSQENSNLNRRITRSMSHNILMESQNTSSSDDDDIGYLFSNGSLPTYQIIINTTWRQYSSGIFLPLQVSHDSDPNATENTTHIRIGFPNSYIVTGFDISRITLHFDNVTACENSSNSRRPVDHIIGTVLHSQSRSSENNEFGTIEVVLRVTNSINVYVVVVNDYNCVQMHKNLYGYFVNPNKRDSLTTHPEIFNYVKRYLITLRSTIIAQYNNLNVESLLNSMNFENLLVDLIFSPPLLSQNHMPTINTVAHNENGIINYKIFI